MEEFSLLMADAIYRQFSQFYIDKNLSDGAVNQKQSCNIAKADPLGQICQVFGYPCESGLFF